MLNVLTHSYWLLLRGTLETLELSAATLVLSSVIGFIAALLRLFGPLPARVLVDVYIFVIRGVPLLLLLFFMYFGLPFAGINLPAWSGGVLVMGVYFGALMCEVWRAAIQGLPRGQWDAARALGMRLPLTLEIVVLPQSIRVAAAPMINTLVLLVKSTSLVSIIGLSELTRTGLQIVERTFAAFQIMGAVALIYFVVCYLLSRFGKLVEKRMQYGH